MSSRFDCPVTTLLCEEEDSSVLDDHDESSSMADSSLLRNAGFGLLPSIDEECVVRMMEKEMQLQPETDYLMKLRCEEVRLDARNDAVFWIGKLHAHFGFGPVCACLAINYVDRFLSSYRLPNKAWTMQLLSVACLSIAAKIDETEVPLCYDLQIAESRFVFEARTIQRMELLVLATLKWRMHAITPFSYVHHFIAKISDSDFPPRFNLQQCSQTILSMTKGYESLEFRPSEIAAAAAIEVLGEETGKAISLLEYDFEKERIMKCMKLVALADDACNMRKRGSALSLPYSPVGVLDANCFSSGSDDMNGDSCVNSEESSPLFKRRKLRV